MTIPVLQITDAGLAAVQALQGTDKVTITELGLTDTAFIAAPTLTALPGEFKRIETVGGEAAAENLTHLSAYDISDDAWVATGIGLYLDDGTLFAAYSGEATLISKATLSFGLIDCDIAFATDLSASIAFGSPVFTVPPATTEMRGIVRLATAAQGIEGVDPLLAITCAVLKAALDAFKLALLAAAATPEEALAGGIADKVMVPASLPLILAAIADKVPLDRTIGTAGLLTGGADLNDDLELAVAKASAALLLAATDDQTAVTPASLGALAHLHGTSGYQTIPGGLVLQWGRGTAVINGTSSHTFPISFPSACFTVVASGGVAGGNEQQDNGPDVIQGSITTTGFQCFSALDSAAPFGWIAIGK